MTRPAPSTRAAQSATSTGQSLGSKSKIVDLLQIPASLATITSAAVTLGWTVRILSAATLAVAGAAVWVQRQQGRPWRNKWVIVTLTSCLIGLAGLSYSFVPQAGSEPQPTGTTGSSVNIGTNRGQVIVGGTVINNVYNSSSDPNPHGPTVETNSCPVDKSPQRGSVDTLAIELFVRPYRDGECWVRSTVIGETPSTVEFEIRYVNTSNVIQKNVDFSVSLPPSLHMIPGTTYLANSVFPSGINIKKDSIVSNGIDDGDYEPGAAGYFAFEVQTPAIDNLKCGANVIRTIVYVHPKDLDYFSNTADVDLTRAC